MIFTKSDRPFVIRKTLFMISILLAAILLGVDNLNAFGAGGEIISVNSSDDSDDGQCDSTHCSLREAIQLANNQEGLDQIEFNVPGSGVHTIQPLIALPVVTDAVIIDGYSQPGATPNTFIQGNNAVLAIELDGSLAGGGVDGLKIRSGNSIVRGLVIDRFGGDGIQLEQGDGNIIEGNFVGTDTTGQVDYGNAINGILIQGGSTNNVIGGSSPEDRNLISGNNFAGVNIFTSGNSVQGNYIGTNADGNAIIRNNVVGITIQQGSANNRVGGTQAGAGNVISGNGNLNEGGLTLITGAHHNVVQGNFIGTDASGSNNLGNNGPGVYIVGSASNNTIGGTDFGAGNIVAFNKRDGFRVLSGTGNAIQGNSIHANSGLGIDHNDDGVTPNDQGDSDTGPNGLQNFPVLDSIVVGGRNTFIEGELNSWPNRQFEIEFFISQSCDPSGHGEGETFVGSEKVVTDSDGNVDFSFSLIEGVTRGQFVTATASDRSGNTSEFSMCLRVRF